MRQWRSRSKQRSLNLWEGEMIVHLQSIKWSCLHSNISLWRWQTPVTPRGKDWKLHWKLAILVLHQQGDSCSSLYRHVSGSYHGCISTPVLTCTKTHSFRKEAPGDKGARPTHCSSCSHVVLKNEADWAQTASLQQSHTGGGTKAALMVASLLLCIHKTRFASTATPFTLHPHMGPGGALIGAIHWMIVESMYLKNFWVFFFAKKVIKNTCEEGILNT